MSDAREVLSRVKAVAEVATGPPAGAPQASHPGGNG